MCVVFIDSSGVILVHMVPAGRTVKEAYLGGKQFQDQEIRYAIRT